MEYNTYVHILALPTVKWKEKESRLKFNFKVEFVPQMAEKDGIGIEFWNGRWHIAAMTS